MSVKTKNNEHKNINDEISATTTYTIDGNYFVVEPIFKTQSSETLGTILLRLLTKNN